MYELSNCLWVPKADFSPAMRKTLTLSVYAMDGTKTEVKTYRTDRKGFIGIPRVFGLKSFANCAIEDYRSDGHAVTFGKKIKLREEQIPFVDDMMKAVDLHEDFIAEAATGKGKTVCALEVIRRLGRSAFVLVDQENLKDQWVERCVQHLGMQEGDIGIVQGKKENWQGKAITICMVQTLASRKFSEEFYAAAGVVVFDECHTVGAPTFSKTLTMFHAGVRFGISATPDRNDVLHKAISFSLGSTAAFMYDPPEPSLVYIAPSNTVYSWAANNSKLAGRFINEIASDGARNLEIAKAAQWLYETGRDVLVVSDRIEQLSALIVMCRSLGMPAEDMGLYAKSRVVYQYEKNPRPVIKPFGLVKGAAYTPIRLAMVQKTIPKPQLLAVKESARVIFATYGIIAKGVDIPRLSAGVDATPRSQATQLLGRILRTLPGKLTPIWVTFEDYNSFRSLHQLRQRLGDYHSSNAGIYLWNRAKGRKPLDIRMYKADLGRRIELLRRSQIVMSLDGSNTLIVPSTPASNAS